MMFAHLWQKHTQKRASKIVQSGLIASVAFVGGLLGVGGGAVYLPLFMLLGIDTHESISLTSLLIPFVSFSGFFAYTAIVQIDWMLLGVVGVAALFGGIVAQAVTKKITNERILKIFIAFLLIFAGAGMIVKEMV